MNTKKELGYLHDAIYAFGMHAFWADSPFVNSEDEVQQRVAKKTQEAEASFLQAMQSPKNNGTEAYREWAVRMALGLKNPKHKVR